MTNDINTLNGALQELGELMAENLEEQGVTASASDGLTTLANKILDIQGSDVDITLTSSTSVIISGGSVTLSATLLFDTYPIPNAIITFKDGSTTLGTSTTDSNGVATYTTTSISNGNVSASCGDISDTTTITILPDNHIEIEYTGSSFSSYTGSPFIFTGKVLVDWGDNNISEYTGHLAHNYSSSGDYTIKIYGNITALNNYAFYNRTGITSITLPETVVSVGANTFLRASGLVSLYVPESLTSFGEACFYESGITDFYFKWDTANEIVAYDLNWIWGTLNSPIFHIPQGTTSLYVAKDYPSSKLVEEIPYDGIVLSAQKSVLSYKDNDKTDLYAQLQYNGSDVAVSGVTVTFKQGSTVLGTATTDVNGKATLTDGYTSTGVGDVSLTATDGSLLSETYSIEDLPFYADSMQKIKDTFIADTTTASGRTIYLSPFTFSSDVEIEFKLKNIPNNWLIGFGSNGTTVNNKGGWFKLQNYNQNKASIMYVDTGGSARDVGITTDYGTSTVFTIKSENIHKIYWYLNSTIQAYRDTQTTIPLGLRVDIFDNQDYDVEYIKVKPL